MPEYKHMARGGTALYDEIVINCPGYGGGMSSAKAALESDTRVLAYEAGRKFQVRVNTISAGPLGSRAAKAIGFIDDMIRWAERRHLHTLPCICLDFSLNIMLCLRERSESCFALCHSSICMMIVFCRYSYANAPIQKELEAREVGNAAAFLLSPLASAVTGSTVYVDNGLNAMGLAPDSQALARAEQPVAAS